MGYIHEINIVTKTVNIGEYNIDDMIQMFGTRIEKAVYQEENYKGLDSKKISKIIKKWKFWNNDIRIAYKKYTGYILAPYIIINEPPIVIQ